MICNSQQQDMTWTTDICSTNFCILGVPYIIFLLFTTIQTSLDMSFVSISQYPQQPSRVVTKYLSIICLSYCALVPYSVPIYTPVHEALTYSYRKCVLLILSTRRYQYRSLYGVRFLALIGARVTRCQQFSCHVRKSEIKLVCQDFLIEKLE